MLYDQLPISLKHQFHINPILTFSAQNNFKRTQNYTLQPCTVDIAI